MRVLITGATAAVFTLFSLPAESLDASVVASYTAEYTDNTARLTDNETAELIHRPGVLGALSHDGDSVTASLNYQVERRIHEKSIFSDETIGTGSGLFEWRAVPDRLALYATNSRTDTTIDARGQDTPDNRQTLEYTSAGADLTLDSVSNHQVVFGYKFGRTSTEETRTDSNRHIGTMEYVVPLSGISQLGLLGTLSDVDFDNPLAPDYRSRSGELQFSSGTRKLQYGISAGYQTIDRDLNRETIDGFVGAANAMYRFSENTALALDASRNIQDTFDSGAREFTVTENGLPNRTDTNEVYTEDSFGLSLATQRGRTQLNFGAFYSERDYEDLALNEDRSGLTFGAARQVSRKSTIGIDAGLEDREFVDLGEDETFLRGSVFFLYAPWRALSLQLTVAYNERDSNENTADYEEWVGLFTVRYLVFGNPNSINSNSGGSSSATR
ncbi:MAG: hypothetical protein RIE06_27785 [Roseibium album]|uniref:hypothetical protein n=1 Tax=Roseibium album TaxID=311410 RepID=UPI0032EE1640